MECSQGQYLYMVLFKKRLFNFLQAQMMASEYKKRGGDYTTDKKDKDESQQNLTNWGEEDWQTKDGEGKAKQEDGTEKRYLPKKAWENMSEKEKEETDQKVNGNAACSIDHFKTR